MLIDVKKLWQEDSILSHSQIIIIELATYVDMRVMMKVMEQKLISCFRCPLKFAQGNFEKREQTLKVRYFIDKCNILLHYILCVYMGKHNIGYFAYFSNTGNIMLWLWLGGCYYCCFLGKCACANMKSLSTCREQGVVVSYYSFIYIIFIFFLKCVFVMKLL